MDHQPVPGSQVAIEAAMAVRTARRALVIGPLLVALAMLWRGGSGALAAALGVAVVVVNFLLSGAILSWAARVSLAMYHAAALLGFLLRLALLTLAVFVLSSLLEIDRVAFALSAILAYLGLLVMQARQELTARS